MHNRCIVLECKHSYNYKPSPSLLADASFRHEVPQFDPPATIGPATEQASWHAWQWFHYPPGPVLSVFQEVQLIRSMHNCNLPCPRFNFAKGFAANVCILASLGWLVTTIVMHDLAAPLPRAFKTAACLTQYLLITWAIITILLSTSFPFFFGECRLRLTHGFRPVEIVIRDIPSRIHASAGKDHECQSWKSILRGIDSRLVFYNPLAFLSEDFWTLDYDAVMHARKLIAEGKLDESDFEFAIWRLEQGVWRSREAWRIHALCVDHHIMTLIKVRSQMAIFPYFDLRLDQSGYARKRPSVHSLAIDFGRRIRSCQSLSHYY